MAENPGVNNLKKFWTKDPEGLAKWAEKPHPWKTLRNHLLRVAPQLGEDRANRIATEWFHEVFGDYPGSDTARVRKGKPPRGKLIGPG